MSHLSERRQCLKNTTLAGRTRFTLGVLSLSAIVGCGAEAAFPGGDNRTVVISDGMTTVLDNPSGNNCLMLPGGACISPKDKCGAGAHAEVVLGPDGKVANIVCYPDKVSSYTLVEQQPSASVDNKGLLVFDGKVDGPDIAGDLNVTGNNATVYGQGPVQSVVGGNLTVSYNNATIRGISVLGDTTIVGNNTVMYYCVIVGNVLIPSNDNILSGCDIYGNVTVTGNNNQLLALRIQGTLSNRGNGNVCASDFRFTDVNQNKVIEPIEVGAALTCN